MKRKTWSGLLAWYDAHKRDLPWRRSKDPYHVWVSEIMLQQTRVETVIPYFDRWIARFPSIDRLAGADEQDVLKQWEGLGYYSRARHLHAAARLVRERHNGSLPASYESLRALPGIGDYTAGAIASIAYNQRTAAIDGNVRRVLSRLLDVPAPDAKSLSTAAAALVPAERPGDYNQALMELGARICKPRLPTCDVCPVRAACLARRRGTIDQRPGRKAGKAIPTQVAFTLVRVHEHAVLLARRPSTGLLAGTWEFPQVTERPAAPSIGSYTHTFSHKRITYEIFLADDHRPADAGQRWVGLDETSRLPFSTAQRRIEAIVRTRLSQFSVV